MGYYDQGYTKKRKIRLSGWKLTMLGGFAGICITSLAFIIAFNIWPSFGNVASANEKAEQKAVEATSMVESPLIQQTTPNLGIYEKIPQAVEKVSAAVVGVNRIQASVFGGAMTQAGSGSGVIYKKTDGSAFVVTNNHVVEGAERVEVTLKDGTKEPAEIVGTDPLTDLAVLKIDGEHVQAVAKLGSSKDLRLGEPVLAIGNPLGQRFSGSVTMGIISGMNRNIPIDLNRDGESDWEAEVIQTDAAINPGNSGGALINVEGEVIGINSMKIAQEAVEGIGLAIPVSTVKPVIEDLEMYKEVRRPFIGVALKPLLEIPGYHWQETLKLPSEVKSGVAVLNVVPNSPAERAGLKKYDVIVALDEQRVANTMDIRRYLYSEKEIGDKLEVTFYRNGEKQTVELELIEGSL